MRITRTKKERNKNYVSRNRNEYNKKIMMITNFYDFQLKKKKKVLKNNKVNTCRSCNQKLHILWNKHNNKSDISRKKIYSNFKRVSKIINCVNLYATWTLDRNIRRKCID